MRHHLVCIDAACMDGILSGLKRIMCRWSVDGVPPFEGVETGDLLWFKLPSRPIQSLSPAGRCLYQRVETSADFHRFVAPYTDLITNTREQLNEAAKSARYISLIWVEAVALVEPTDLELPDEHEWHVLDAPPSPRCAGESH